MNNEELHHNLRFFIRYHQGHWRMGQGWKSHGRHDTLIQNCNRKNKKGKKPLRVSRHRWVGNITMHLWVCGVDWSGLGCRKVRRGSSEHDNQISCSADDGGISWNNNDYWLDRKWIITTALTERIRLISVPNCSGWSARVGPDACLWKEKRPCQTKHNNARRTLWWQRVTNHYFIWGW